MTEQSQFISKHRGKLSIFLGYTSYSATIQTLLKAALHRLQEGSDVFCAAIETHEIEQTENLLSDFTGCSQLQNVDLQTILSRQPDLVLLDHLEHVNPPNSHHPRRYQDIEELLDAGIDVYTTLDVQYIESLNDVIQQITGVSTQVTVPDRLIDQAHQVVFVDVIPEDLLKQIESYPAYLANEKQFYRLGNLCALRELALRRTAQHVDHKMRSYMEAKSIPGPWAASERILVCVSSSPFSVRLVRTGCRLARDLNAEWFVVYVEEPHGKSLIASHQQQLQETMKLAESLGARVERIAGTSIADALLDFAQYQNITKIVIGQPLRSRWREILSGSIVNQLTHRCGHIDVYVINSGEYLPPVTPEFRSFPMMDYRKYLQVGLGVILTTVIALLVNSVITLDPANLVMFYLLLVVIIALRLGYGPSILTAVVSVFVFNFFFVPPQHTMLVADAQYLLTFIGLLSAGIIIASLTSRAHHQTEVARRREHETSQLLSLTRELSATVDVQEIIKRIVRHIHQTFQCDVALYLEDDQHSLTLFEQSDSFPVELVDLEMLQWAHEHKSNAGLGTATQPTAPLFYVPLITSDHSLGMLVLRLDQPLQVAKQNLLDAFAKQAALALDAVKLGEEAQQARLLREKEKFQSILLNSVSHDLRTPLVSIIGTLSSLLDQNSQLDEASRQNLLVDAYSEADRLNQLVRNLLDISRLEGGSLKLKRELYDLSEVIGVARTQLRSRMENRAFIIQLDDDLPMIELDIALFAQVLLNLLDNAFKYSDIHSPVEIQASVQNNQLQIKIGDRGSGIPKNELPHIFDKFFRASNVEGRGGSGLGLAICQGIVEAHNGTIRAENRAEGGTWFIIDLPIQMENEIREQNKNPHSG